jgi:hypothetical protein
MMWTVTKIVVLVLILAALHVWIMAAPFSSSRWHRQLADAIWSFGLAIYFAFAAATGAESKWAFALSGVAIGFWVIRTARFFMHKDV